MDASLYDLVRDDPRYPVEAYEFLSDAVEYTQEALGREPHEDDDPDTDYHVSAAELTRGACDLAVREFGMMAPIVFRMWGIHSTLDVGHVVFNLIRVGRLKQSDRDDLADFDGLFDLQTALTPSAGVSAGRGQR